MSDIGIIESLTRRVEELERGNLGNFVYLMDVGSRKSWVIDQGLAMAIMQALPKGFPPPEPSVSVNDPAVDYLTKDADRLNRMTRHCFGDNHSFAIDPEASPSGIPFEVALMYYKAGRDVRRMAFPEVGASVMFSPESDLWTTGGVLADDWYVIPKEEKP